MSWHCARVIDSVPVINSLQNKSDKRGLHVCSLTIAIIINRRLLLYCLGWKSFSLRKRNNIYCVSITSRHQVKLTINWWIAFTLIIYFFRNYQHVHSRQFRFHLYVTYYTHTFTRNYLLFQAFSLYFLFVYIFLFCKTHLLNTINYVILY